MRLLYLVACIEGFSTLAVEIIALRLAAPVVGSSSIVTSVFLGIILLALSAGYRYGGVLASKLPKERIRILIGIYLVVAALFYRGVSFAFEQNLLAWGLDVIGGYIPTLFLTAFLLFFLPVYLASQTVPLLTELIDNDSKGKAAGKILFASTVGSFFGSVLTSIVFFQYLGVSLTSTLVTLLLLLVTALWRRKSFPGISLLLALLSGLLLIFSFMKPAPVGEIYSFDSAYQQIRVAEGYQRNNRDIRVYHTNGSFASALYVDTKESPFAYIQEALARTQDFQAKDVLVIGAAGFSYPYELDLLLPNLTSIDVVDIDPQVKHIAERYFLEETLSSKIHFVPESARFFLNKKKMNNETYDLVFLDAFHGKAIPGELTTKEFFEDIHTISPEGVFLVNMILDAELESDVAKNILTTMQAVRGEIWITPATPDLLNQAQEEIQNFIVATKQLTPEYVRAIGGGVVYTDDKRSTEKDTMELYW